MAGIHPSAVIEPGAKVASGAEVGACCTVGPNVELHPGVVLRPHVHVTGRTTIGEGTRIFSFATIGEEPQDKGFVPGGDDTALEIGSGNVIREHTSIHVGTRGGGGVTRIGDDNLLMNGAHVGHDTQIGSHCIVATNVAIGGHCHIGDHAVLGGLVGVHQFVRVGESAMVAGMSGLRKDAPPFSLVAGGAGATLRGVNELGLRRRGFSDEVRAEIKRAYKLFFYSKLRFEAALAEARAAGFGSEEAARLIHFLECSKRGFCRP